MVEFVKSGASYYRVTAKGEKTRISKDEYLKKKAATRSPRKSPRKSARKSPRKSPRRSPRKSTRKSPRKSPRKGKKRRSPGRKKRSPRKPRHLKPFALRETSPRSVKYKGDPGYFKCRDQLQSKIKTNIKDAKWTSRAQAIAVSYSQVNEAFPECQKYFVRPSPKKRSPRK